MTRLSELDWDRIEAARQNAHYLRSEVTRDMVVAIGSGIRKLFSGVHLHKGSGATPAST
jgi:hypothetical protein